MFMRCEKEVSKWCQKMGSFFNHFLGWFLDHFEAYKFFHQKWGSKFYMGFGKLVEKICHFLVVEMQHAPLSEIPLLGPF